MTNIHRVTFRNANHNRTWSTVVRALDQCQAIEVAWAYVVRPKWCVKSSAIVSDYDPRTDPAVRGFAREVDGP